MCCGKSRVKIMYPQEHEIRAWTSDVIKFLYWLALVGLTDLLQNLLKVEGTMIRPMIIHSEIKPIYLKQTSDEEYDSSIISKLIMYLRLSLRVFEACVLVSLF